VTEKTKKICGGSGCLRTVDEGTRFCDECKPKPKNAAARWDDGIRKHVPASSDWLRYDFLYRDPRWTRLSKSHKKAHPFCQQCDTEMVGIVDHAVPAGEAIRQAQESGRYSDKHAGFFIASNLQSLCHKCHAVKTAEDKAHTGPWPSVIDMEAARPKKVWSF
jgi:hypothetical protein